MIILRFWYHISSSPSPTSRKLDSFYILSLCWKITNTHIALFYATRHNLAPKGRLDQRKRIIYIQESRPRSKHTITMSSTAGEAEKAVNTTTQNGSADKSASAPKKEKAPKAEAGKTEEAAADEDSKKISGAELKKQKQAEKAARREKEKADRMAQLGQSAATPQTPAKGAKGGDLKKGGEAAQKGGPAQGQAQHKKGQSQGGNLPMRGKPGTGGVVPMTQQQQPQRKTKEVGLFGHLYTSASKRNTMEGVSKEVHPAVLALGLQMSSFTVCGSNARCVAMLLAFKKVSFTVRPLVSLFIQLTRNNRPFLTIKHHTTRPLHAISHRTTSHLRSTTSNHTVPSPSLWAMPFAG
jgi:hypothetical protein